MRWRWVLIATVLAIVAAACGSVAENVSERIVEQAIESQGDGDVNVEFNDDGSVDLSVEGEDGNSISIGSNVPIPDELTIPVPDGGSATASGTDGSYVFVALTYPQDRYDELVAFYDAWTEGTGGEWARSQSTLDMGGDTMRTAQWSEGPTAITVTDCFSVSGEGDSLNAACVTVNESQ
jgi:hypothetical protein